MLIKAEDIGELLNSINRKDSEITRLKVELGHYKHASAEFGGTNSCVDVGTKAALFVKHRKVFKDLQERFCARPRDDGSAMSATGITTDIARDLTEFYTLKARQEECGKTGHEKYTNDNHGGSVELDFCNKCGKDLRGNT